jgi:tetraacyldisaccharide 4'-kinase
MRAPDFWHARPGLAAGLLSPLSSVWQAAARLRRTVARPYRAAVPVICVGNLIAGGSGKTPVVLSLLAMLRQHGLSVHVVTRGYGGRLGGPVQVDPLRHDAEAVGDEPMMIATRGPCWIARDRPAGIAAALAAGAEIVVLDDGFQNPSIIKDCAMVVVDAAYGFGNGRVIPAGPLREPSASGLRHADAIVLLGQGIGPPEIAAAGRPVHRADIVPIDGDRLAGRRFVAFAGIGRPEKFFATLRDLGVQLTATHGFPDHHRFRTHEILRLRVEAARAEAGLITTAKDWARLPAGIRDGIEVLEVEISWRDARAMAHLLTDVAARRNQQHATRT